MSFIRKIKKAQLKKSEPDSNESYEGKLINDMNNEIEEAFAKKGEEVGMNEMCNNVIDNISMMINMNNMNIKSQLENIGIQMLNLGIEIFNNSLFFIGITNTFDSTK